LLLNAAAEAEAADAYVREIDTIEARMETIYLLPLQLALRRLFAAGCGDIAKDLFPK
jgi:hypothetical protein